MRFAVFTRACLTASALVAAPLSAALVVNPVPAPIAPGLTAAIEQFVTIPASDPAAPSRARIQYITAPGDGSGRLFVNDQRGQFWLTNTAGAAPTQYLDLATRDLGFIVPSGEGGFIGAAFHPNFNGNATAAGYGTFYTHYSATQASGVANYLENDNGNHEGVIREWVVATPGAALADVVSTREILRVGQFASNHNGGTIAFNPTAAAGSNDYGKLYIGLGDGGGANDPRDNGQDRSNPLGKILRIDPLNPSGGLAYSIPDDNPFVSTPDPNNQIIDEIWAYGLRNPQQFSWDSQDNLYISDIGQAQLEEVNLGQAGANYGWPVREGTFAKDPDKTNLEVYTLPGNDGSLGFTYPISQYDHDEGAAIGGGFLYEGDAVPELRGQFVLSEINDGRIFYFSPEAATAGGTAPMRELLLTLNGQPFTFIGSEGYNNRVDLRLSIDEAGELYMLTKRDGDIFRFVAAAAPGAIPEPASWAMMIAGFGLAGMALRRREAEPRPA